MAVPVTSDPVNAILATSGCWTNPVPAALPRPVTTLNTPAGRPASSTRRASSRVLADANSDGLTTTEHPAAMAGAALTVVNHKGEFQAVRAATTPTGSRVVKANASAFSVGIVAPWTLSASP